MLARLLLLALYCALPCAVADNVSAVFAPNPARFGSQPPPRVGSVAALTENGTAVVFGGMLPGGALAPPDVWEYNAVLDRWACLCDSTAQTSPPPRTGHSASYAQGKVAVAFGRAASGELLRDVWVFDTLGIAWRQVALLNSTVQPRPRAGHAAVLSTNSSLQLSLLVFGGASGSDVLDDVWQLSMAYDPLFQNVTGSWQLLRSSASVTLSSGAPAPGARSRRRLLLALPALLLVCAL